MGSKYKQDIGCVRSGKYAECKKTKTRKLATNFAIAAAAANGE